MTGCSGSGVKIRGKVYGRFEVIIQSQFCQSCHKLVSLLRGFLPIPRHILVPLRPHMDHLYPQPPPIFWLIHSPYMPINWDSITFAASPNKDLSSDLGYARTVWQITKTFSSSAAPSSDYEITVNVIAGTNVRNFNALHSGIQ